MSRSKPKRRKHKKKHYLLKFIIVVLICAAAGFVMHLSYFNISGIAVMGNEDISDEEIIKLSGVKEGESIFHAQPLLVKYKVKDNLYIDKVKTKWKMPDKVIITVSEKTAMAQFKKGGKFVVTDIDGTVIEVTDKERKATLIDNIKVTSAKRKDVIEVKDEEQAQKALKLVAAADENDLYFKRISMSGNKVDAYIFDELVCKGKYGDLVSCIKSGTLKSVVYDLYQKDKEKGTITVSSDNYCFFTP
ncbi:MAG: FtsQ-type POTRA domain-containing protein [Bacillota bacterium]|nr:FtsQ-type POTRA domain-containing protein [Bacillota bacterium]